MFFSSLVQWKPSDPLRTALLVDLSTALIAHGWFRKYEPDSVGSGLARLAVFAIAPIATSSQTSSSPLVNIPLHLALFITFLLSSILIYRISPFHPLAKYPGPIICKISKFWFAWLAHKGKFHLYFEELHKKYGPVVRIGPNELSVVHADLIPLVLGPQGMPKGPMWEGRHFAPGKKDRESLVAVRDFTIHTRLRKPWNRAFGQAALKDYEESLINRGIQLIEILNGKAHDSPDGVGHVDMSSFGENFDLMNTDDKDNIIQRLDDAHWFPGISQTIPWAWSFLIPIPALTKNSVAFGGFVFQHAIKRGKRTDGKRDLFYHLKSLCKILRRGNHMQAANMNIDDDKPPISLIMSNAILAVVAGSHTTSFVLSSIMYHLIRYPEYLRRLQKELDTAFPPSEHTTIQLDKLANLELLDAIINEVLRLQPAVMTHLQRAPSPGSGGRFLKDLYIPEGTAVIIPPYVMHRDPRYFSPNSDKFWPERWYTQRTDIILERTAFIPFSYGPAGCVGKPLAMMELRYITAMLVYNFDFSFEDGYNPDRWNEELADRFNVIKGSLPVKMRQRNVHV